MTGECACPACPISPSPTAAFAACGRARRMDSVFFSAITCISPQATGHRYVNSSPFLVKQS